MKKEKNDILKIMFIVLLFCFVIFSKNQILFGQTNDIDLLYEPLTYTPYWYKGSALPTLKSQIKVVVFPSSSSLIYDWYVNNKKQFTDSGLGREYFVFEMKEYNNYNITVKIYNENENLLYEKAVILSVGQTEPEIIFYEENPLTGTVFNQILKENLNLTKETINIIAEPFYFSDFDNLEYNWKMNNRTISPQGDEPRTIDLQRPSSGSGVSNVSLNINNPMNVFQSMSEKINIIY